MLGRRRLEHRRIPVVSETETQHAEDRRRASHGRRSTAEPQRRPHLQPPRGGVDERVRQPRERRRREQEIVGAFMFYFVFPYVPIANFDTYTMPIRKKTIFDECLYERTKYEGDKK